MDIDIRPLSDPAQLHDWLKVTFTGFLNGPVLDPAVSEARGREWDITRCLGAYDGDDRCVATLRSFPQRLTAVGGGTVTADAVTAVVVSTPYRRQGLLRRMMEHELRTAKERGDMIATLIAAQYPIYGRFGFGPASWVTKWRVDVTRSGLDRRNPGQVGGGRTEFVDSATVRELGPALHERFRAGQPGAAVRTGTVWDERTGRGLRRPDYTEPYRVLYRSASGEVEGMLAYDVTAAATDGKQPDCTATVRELIALNPVAERALWEFVCAVDQVTTVVSDFRAPDDVLPLLLPDPRAAEVTSHADWLWVRVLDVVRALEARTYETPGTLVLEVTDRQGLAGGRYRLTVEPGGAARCVPSEEAPDLTLDVADLAPLWLGDEAPSRLAALGRLVEHGAGAVATADRVFRTARRPWAPDMF